MTAQTSLSHQGNILVNFELHDSARLQTQLAADLDRDRHLSLAGNPAPHTQIVLRKETKVKSTSSIMASMSTSPPSRRIRTPIPLGSGTAKRTSPITHLVEQPHGAHHATIPVNAPRFNGVVENFHGRVEDEFYLLEILPTKDEMRERLFGYILYHNFGRPTKGLGMKMPVETLQAKDPKISPDVSAFPPVVFDRIESSAEELLPRISQIGDIRPDTHKSSISRLPFMGAGCPPARLCGRENGRQLNAKGAPEISKD
jgi:hypothetical protein